ncbi:MAG: CDP-alcohol phosphatidyltransferase family protein [Anaerolineales bacterium]|jgi:CDP-diacylglycerol--glycerol-3-phosphate 3-phosphatidyltransferase
MHADESAQPNRQTLTDVLRGRFKGYLDPVCAFLNRLGIQPNTITLTGLAGNLVAAFFLSQGQFLVGGLIALVMGAMDALDGGMARQRGEPTDYGAFIDSVTDRYSELLLYGGLLLYYSHTGDQVMVLLIYLAAVGSVMVSYTRARAEGLGYEAKWGILTRAERFAVFIPSLIFSVPVIGLALVAVFGNITALQRIYVVRKQTHDRG